MNEQDVKTQNKLSKLENSILDLIMNNKFYLFMLAITLLAIIARTAMFSYQSGDFVSFLQPWGGYLTQPGLSGIKAMDTDYPMIYMYVLKLCTLLPWDYLTGVKLFSMIFDFVCAIGGYLIVGELFKESKSKRLASCITYSAILFLPTVLINSSLWGQCDAIYAGFIMLAIYFFMKDKYSLMCLMIGLGASFKIHTLLILPALIILYIRQRKGSFLNFLIIPAVIVLSWVPALIGGVEFSKIIAGYGYHFKICQRISANFINIYTLAGNFANVADPILILNMGKYAMIGVIGILSMLVLCGKKTYTKDDALKIFVWFYLVTIFVLPGAHDRYLFPLDVLSIVYFIRFKKVLVSLVVNAVSYLCYMGYMSAYYDQLYMIMSYAYLAVVIVYSVQMYKDLNTTNNVENVAK